MANQVSFSPGHDPEYPLRSARRAGPDGGERTAGGYYINAAQKGEPPGVWFGSGLAALGLREGQEVHPDDHLKVLDQRHPRTGESLGRRPDTGYAKTLARLRASEPHRTVARDQELQRAAAQQHRPARPYTDCTVRYSKSVSVVHGSIRENARQAALAGDLSAEAHWADVQARFAQVELHGAMAAMRRLDEWAMTRAGTFRQIDDQQFGRYEPAGLVANLWLQGTSRDGDPHDHVHCVIARMCVTGSDGKWRAVDTMTLRHQGGVAKLLSNAYHQAALRQEFGLGWTSTVNGNEIAGVTPAQMDAYSSRRQEITAETRRRCAEFEVAHGRAPNRAEVRRINELVWGETRKRKKDDLIDWDVLAAHWDATLGGELAQIAQDLGLGPGAQTAATAAGQPPAGLSPAEAAEGRLDGWGPPLPEQWAAEAAALARVQAKHPAWTKSQLCGELADCLPPSIAELPPQAAMDLALQMADRIINGEIQTVVCLDAPEPADERLRPEHRRDLDGRSVFVRPGVSRYATGVQLDREEQLLAHAQQDSAPRLTRAQAASLLSADPAVLDAQLRESVRAEDSRAVQPSGLTAAQQAAAYHVLTSPRRCEPIEAGAGAGKTRVLAQIARMARAAGLPVYGTGPTQQSVLVLTEEAAAAGVELGAWNTARLLGQRRDGTYRGRRDLPYGAVLLVDEGSMVSLEHYARLMAYAAERNVKVIVAGDRNQLSAVEHGGGFAFVADKLGVVQLPDPVRFSHRWEQEASLRLRAGDTSVLTEYAARGRISGAAPEAAKEQARRAYVAEYAAGRAPLMLAATNELVDEMNDMIREDLRHLGLAQRDGPQVELMHGRHAGVGDPIVLRTNHHDAQSGEEGRGLANGDTLEIAAITPDGTVLVRRILDAAPGTGQRRYTGRFPFAYSRESQLAHVVTGHRAQGRTVTAGITLFTGDETHEWGYPALTRGRDSNHAIVFTYSAKRADPRPGTREAPELARAHWVEQERAARDRRVWPDPDRVDKQQLEALGVLSDVLERPERELSATQWKEREAASADHLAKLHAEWQHYARAAWTARYEAELRDALPPELRDTELSGATTWLWRDLRAAEAAGLNSRDVLREAVNKRGLGDARSISAVIFARVQNSTAGLIPLVPRPWAERVLQVDDPQLQAHLEARAAQMDARVERLGEHTAHTSPAWAVAAIGPVPDEPLKRLEWQTRVAPVAAYRELYGWDHETEPIGPEPTSDTPEKRADWHGAFAALSPAQGGVDMRAEPDDRLWLMAGTYATVTHEAPRYVGNELRFLRVTARDMHLRAVRHAFEERIARERGDQEAAARHAQREASAKAVGERVKAAEARLATSQAAYDEWEQQTTRDRWLPLAARAELQRRHPQMQLPPLRSAEPEPPSEAERRELLWPRIDQQGNVRSEPDHEAAPEPGTGAPGQSERPRARWPQVDRHGVVSDPPQWVLDAEQQAAETREKLAARASQKVPEEDHEWGDVGSAWPGLAERERDAILQPAKPQMQPARDYAGRDAQPEKEYAAAQPESGG